MQYCSIKIDYVRALQNKAYLNPHPFINEATPLVQGPWSGALSPVWTEQHYLATSPRCLTEDL